MTASIPPVLDQGAEQIAARLGISSTARSGLAFMGSADAIRYLVEFVTSIVLARLLAPRDFGAVAVVYSFLEVSYVVGNLGMGGALVQSHELSISDRHTAFTISTIIGLVFTVVGAALGSWVARFFHMEILAAVMPLLSLQMLFAGVYAAPLALLQRELRFGRLFLVEGVSTVVYTVMAIGLAITGHGVWSLVLAPLFSGGVRIVSSCLLAQYWPKVRLHRESLHKLIGFGGGLTLKNIFVYLGRNADNLIVARLLGGTAIGLYNRAFSLSTLPQTRLVGIFYRVCFPIFCAIRGERKDFHDWYEKVTILVTVAVTPLLLGLSIMAKEFTLAVLGEQWSAMIFPLRILCLSSLITCLHMVGGAAIEASGRIRYEVFTQAVNAILIVVGCSLGAAYGLQGVSYAVLASSAILFALKAFALRWAIEYPVRRYFRAPLRSLLAGVVMCVTILVSVDALEQNVVAFGLDNNWARLLTGSVIGCLTYIVALAVIGRPHFLLAVSQLSKLFNSEHKKRSKVQTLSSPA
jgi:O-antigen/teichoic acid export membrane protein